MTGLVDVAYTLLLGWMRALVNWFWSIYSGTGSSGITQWFLSNWKFWLVLLIAGGLVLDWLMWIVRWRPYRLLFGRVKTEPDIAPEESWDEGEGYYAQEAAIDSPQWTDLTLSTLSEIDPNWAGDVDMEAVDTDMDGYYSEGYEEPVPAETEASADEGYWEDAPDGDEMVYDDTEGDYDGPYSEEQSHTQPAQDTAYYYDYIASPQQVNAHPASVPHSYLLGDDEPEEEITSTQAPEPRKPANGPGFDSNEGMRAINKTENEDDLSDGAPQMYGRPGIWPGSFSYESARQSFAEETPQDTTASNDGRNGTKRRRRRLRGNTSVLPEDSFVSMDAFGFDEEDAEQPAETVTPPEEARPSRLVSPVAAPPPVQEQGRRKGLRTVTGKPANRRGFMRFTSAQEEPIAGLPPLDLTDPFMPAARPDNPDFTPDEGEEYE